jgi:ribokinase
VWVSAQCVLPDRPVVAIGHIGRDVVVRVDRLPDSGGAAPVINWWEGLGDKGANQVVGLAQLGVPP